MRYLFILIAFFIVNITNAQPDNITSLIGKSRSFSNNGDFENAIMILSRGLETTDNDINLQIELGNVYAQAGRYKEALPIAKNLASNSDITLQAIQTAGIIFKGNNENGAFEKLYKKAFKAYPESGRLYAEYGEHLLTQEKKECIISWEKGIKADPSYAGNYYFASKYYNANNNILLSSWCAENFINIEYQSARTAEIKIILYNNLRSILTNPNFEKEYAIKGNAFFKAYLNCLNKALAGAGNNGINTNTLTLIRTRFILIWGEKYEIDFPCKLFEYHKQLLVDGTFEAYNQWALGSVENFNFYQNWIEMNKTASDALAKYRSNRIYKVPTGQYYGN
jgi:tetratricopeptide (TPR) repeat protein